MAKPEITQRALTADGVSKTIITQVDADTAVKIYVFDNETQERELLTESVVTDGTLELTYDTPGWYSIEFLNVDTEDPGNPGPVNRYVVQDHAT